MSPAFRKVALSFAMLAWNGRWNGTEVSHNFVVTDVMTVTVIGVKTTLKFVPGTDVASRSHGNSKSVTLCSVGILRRRYEKVKNIGAGDGDHDAHCRVCFDFGGSPNQKHG